MSHYDGDGFHRVAGSLHCEGVPCECIASAVGTPVYVYSAPVLRQRFLAFREAFSSRKALVAFAVKANPNLAVLSVLAAEGAGADTVSQGEIERAIRAGIPPNRIVFSGVGKAESEIAFALKHAIHQINVESVAEFELIAAVARSLGVTAPVAFRINPDVAAGGHAKISTGGRSSKFGLAPNEVRQLYAAATEMPEIMLAGLAVHAGSQITDLSQLEAAFAVVRELADAMAAEGFRVPRLDLGGGLGVAYRPGDAVPALESYARLVERGFGDWDGDFVFEPGRWIAAPAGILLSRIVRVQQRKTHAVAIADAGMNDLARPAIYDAHHEVETVRAVSARASTAYDVAGPVCESSDTFARGVRGAVPQAGDLVAFKDAGAYGASMSSTYNARALVPEVLVDGDRFWLVRRPWTPAEQMDLELVVPSTLESRDAIRQGAVEPRVAKII